MFHDVDDTFHFRMAQARHSRYLARHFVARKRQLPLVLDRSRKRKPLGGDLQESPIFTPGLLEILLSCWKAVLGFCFDTPTARRLI